MWKRTRHSHRAKQDTMDKAAKEADLAMLECAWSDGELDLYYLDESGFCLRMPAEYSYFFKGEQKCLEQTHRRGKRISILGLIQPTLSFTYGLVAGSFDSERYIKMMTEQAQQAQQELERSGRIRVIV